MHRSAMDIVMFSNPPDARDYMKALNIAAKRNHLKIANGLLESLAQVPTEMQRLLSCEDLTVVNPLYMAVDKNHDQYVKQLLQFLSSAGCRDIARMILANNCESSINSLELASLKGSAAIVAMLLNHVPTLDGELLKPLHLARTMCHQEIVNMLLAKMHDRPVRSSEAAPSPPAKEKPCPREAEHETPESPASTNSDATSELRFAPHSVDHPLKDALHTAVKGCDAAAVTALIEPLKKQPQELLQLLRATCTEGNTALHWAAQHGCGKIARVLLEAAGRAKHRRKLLRAVCKGRNTPLHVAADCGSADVVQAILTCGIRKSGIKKIVLSTDDHQQNVLHKACRVGDFKVVKCILEWVKDKADFEALVLSKNNCGRTGLHLAAMRDSVKVARMLLDVAHRMDCVSQLLCGMDSTKRNCLDLAIRGPHLNMMKYLLWRANDVELIELLTMRDCDNLTLFHTAICQGHGGSISMLLSRVAESQSVKQVVLDGNQELIEWSAEKCRDKITNMLLAHFADWEMTFEKEMASGNSLTADGPKNAAYRRVEQTIAFTLKRLGSRQTPTRLRMACDTSWNALQIAAYFNHAEVVKCLVENSSQDGRMAFLRVTTGDWNALHLAAFRGNAEVIATFLAIVQGDIKSLVQFVTSEGLHGWNALHLAAYHNNADVVSCLLDSLKNQPVELHGFVSRPTALRWNALHLAADRGHHNVVRILLDSLKNETVSFLQYAASTGEMHWNALHLAAFSGHSATILIIVNMLRDHPETLAEMLLAVDDSGRNCFCLAVDGQHVVSVDVLLTATNGNKTLAKRLIQDKDGVDVAAIKLAYVRGRSQMVELIHDICD